MAMTRSATRRAMPRFAEEPIGSPTPDEARASESRGGPASVLAGGLQRFPRSYIDAIYRGWSERPRVVTATVLPGPAQPWVAARLQGEQPGSAERRPGVLRRVWQSCLAMIRIWRQRRRQRAELAMMGVAGCNDTGILLGLAAKETGKGFWRAWDNEWRETEDCRQRARDAIVTIAELPEPAQPPVLARLQDEQPGTAEHRPGALRRVWQGWLGNIHMWELYKQTVADLSALSDRELADLGIFRFQIPMVARHGASTPAKAARRLLPG